MVLMVHGDSWFMVQILHHTEETKLSFHSLSPSEGKSFTPDLPAALDETQTFFLVDLECVCVGRCRR